MANIKWVLVLDNAGDCVHAMEVPGGGSMKTLLVLILLISGCGRAKEIQTQDLRIPTASSVHKR